MPVHSANGLFTSTDITSKKVEQPADSIPGANGLGSTKLAIQGLCDGWYKREDNCTDKTSGKTSKQIFLQQYSTVFDPHTACLFYIQDVFLNYEIPVTDLAVRYESRYLPAFNIANTFKKGKERMSMCLITSRIFSLMPWPYVHLLGRKHLLESIRLHFQEKCLLKQGGMRGWELFLFHFQEEPL